MENQSSGIVHMNAIDCCEFVTLSWWQEVLCHLELYVVLVVVLAVVVSVALVAAVVVAE
jgi:hypothetical protein